MPGAAAVGFAREARILATMASLPRGLVVVGRAPSAAGWQGRVRVEPNGAVLEGHFPGEPVLPGVAHLALVLAAIAEMSGRPTVLREVRALRLRRRVGPGAVLEARVGSPSAEGVVGFEVRAEGAIAAAGTVVVAEEEPGG